MIPPHFKQKTTTSQKIIEVAIKCIDFTKIGKLYSSEIFVNFGTFLVAPIFLINNQKVRGSRIENQHNYLHYVNLFPFLAKILKILKNPE